MTRWSVCAAMGAARLLELWWSRRNLTEDAVSGRWSARTWPAMVALHTAVIALTALRGAGRVRGEWLGLLVALQPLRAWVLVLLGERWNARGAVSPRTRVETRGPYALVRHPNYAVVALELVALPLAFGLRWLALGGAAVNAVLLAVRVREEERELMRLPGYRAHFARRARFIPWLF